MPNYKRPLKTTRQVHDFLRDTLELDVSESLDVASACIRIRDAEILLDAYSRFDTLTHEEYRHPHYLENSRRKQLRDQILSELLSNRRPKDDNKIRLGVGGAKPQTKARTEKMFFLVTGLPASGKSGISEKIADGLGAYLIDNDYAKRKFPEFPSLYGASLVHEESQLLTEGQLSDPKYSDASLLSLCLGSGYNIVLPKIGSQEQKILEILKIAKSFGYSFTLVNVDLDREKATRRSFDRFIAVGGEARYVPLSLIFDQYGDSPYKAYDRAKRDKGIDGYLRLSTDVPDKNSQLLIENINCDELVSILGLK